MNKKTLRKINIPFIVLVVAFAGSCDLYSTAPDDDAQDTSAIINRGTIDVQEYFNENTDAEVIVRWHTARKTGVPNYGHAANLPQYVS